jgi:hypothetical protein
VLAPRESSGGFLLVSDAGKARLTAKDGAWQLRLLEGTADWCGTAWSGDDFRRSGEHPQVCSVAADGAELLEPGAKAGAHGQCAFQGERIMVLDALPTEEPYLLVKRQGTVGLMGRKDVSCRSR